MATPAISNNTPSAGWFQWAAFTLNYSNVSYRIPAGRTSQRWVWWKFNNGAPTLVAGADLPSDLTDDDLVLFSNRNGVALRVQATSLVDGDLLIDGSVTTDALRANIINSNHIVTAGLDAGVVKFGSMSGDRILANTINSNHVITAGLDAAVVKFGSMSGARITVGTLNADRIIATSLQAAIVNAGAVNGITITGSTVRTASSGQRVSIENDSSGGIVRFYSGVTNETPTVFDPNLGSRSLPRLVIRTGTTPAYTDPVEVILNSGDPFGSIVSGSIASFEARRIFLRHKPQPTKAANLFLMDDEGVTLTATDLTLTVANKITASADNLVFTATTKTVFNGPVQFAGDVTGVNVNLLVLKAYSTAAVTVSSTSFVNVPIILDLPVASTTEVWEITLEGDVNITTAGHTLIVECRLDGATIPGETHQYIQSVAGRTPGSKSWTVSNMQPGTRFVRFIARVNAAGQTATINPTHTRARAIRTSR